MLPIGNMAMQIKDAASFGALVNKYRKQRGLTQENLSDIAGTGRRFIIDLEKGKDTLQLGNALRVAKALGIDIYGLKLTKSTKNELFADPNCNEIIDAFGQAYLVTKGKKK